MSALTTPVVTVVDGNITTLSTDIAAFFEKPHNDVLKAIRQIVTNLPAERLGNFSQTVVTRANPSGGAPIKSKAYRLTRDGFTFLAMGFTGERAQAFKWAYIDAFNKMEETLRGRAAIERETITPDEQLAIQLAVAHRAQKTSKHFQTIYRAIKVRFQIPRYNELPRCQFAECLKFIDAVDLKVPEVKTAAAPKQEPRALPKSGKPNLTPLNIPEGRKMYRVSEDFLEKQRTFVYCWRYLFRDDLELFYNFLKQTKSPLAPKFAEAIMDFNLCFVEDSLAKLGFAVKDLDCYKHWAAKRLTA